MKPRSSEICQRSQVCSKWTLTNQLPASLFLGNISLTSDSPKGHIVAYEVEEALAERAARNLAKYENVEVRHGNAATDLDDIDAIDLVVAFAGVTHVPPLWISRLTPNAQLLLPLTGQNWWGAMVLAEQSDEGFRAVTLGRCGFYPCAGARRDDLAAQVSVLFENPEHLRDWPLRIIGKGEDIRLEAAV